MYVTNFTNDYDNITSSMYTDIIKDYDKITLFKCTKKENNTDIILPSFLLTKPCGLSFLCLMSFMVYTLTKPLRNKK